MATAIIEQFPNTGMALVSKDLYVAAQISVLDIHHIGESKVFNSVFNLRDPCETSFLQEEREMLESYGVHYYNQSVSPSSMTHELMDEILAEIDAAPKPTLVHCASMMRAGAIGVMHKSCRDVMHNEAIMELVQTMGFDCSQNPDMKNFVFGYIHGKVSAIIDLPEIRKVNEEIFVGAQATGEQFKLLKESGVKSVLNLRSMSEKGTLGLGVLVNEKNIVTELGMAYHNIETVPNTLIPEDVVEEVRALLETIEKPVYIHCRTFVRTADLITKLGYTLPSHDSTLE